MKRLTSMEVFQYCLLCIVLTFTAWVYINAYIDNSSLKKNKEFVKAVVIGFFSGAKGREHVRYEFTADGKLYEDSGRYYPKTDMLSIGDTIYVEYDRTDPTNNRLYRVDSSELKDQP